jgi:hypothetical protein
MRTMSWNPGWLLPTVLLLACRDGLAQKAQSPAHPAAWAMDDKVLVEIAAFSQLIGHGDATGTSGTFALILCVEASAPPKPVLDAISIQHRHVLPWGSRPGSTRSMRTCGSMAIPAIRRSATC